MQCSCMIFNLAKQTKNFENNTSKINLEDTIYMYRGWTIKIDV